MFNPFSKRETRAQTLQSIIDRHVAFSVKAIDLHRKVIAAAPDRLRAIIECFIFNNWVSYHILSEQLDATLPRDTDDATRSQLRHNIREAILAESGNRSLIAVETKVRIETSKYCGDDFLRYVSWQFDEYDSSVERHSTPPAIGAAFRLGAMCDLTDIAVSDFKALCVFRDESCFVYLALKAFTQKDIAAYLKCRKSPPIALQRSFKEAAPEQTPGQTFPSIGHKVNGVPWRLFGYVTAAAGCLSVVIVISFNLRSSATESPRPGPSPTPNASPTESPRPGPSPTPKYCVELPSGGFLNMRQGPGISFPVVQRLQNGVDEVILIGKPVTNGSTRWQKIDSRGVVGWVNADYLAPSDGGQHTKSTGVSGTATTTVGIYWEGRDVQVRGEKASIVQAKISEVDSLKDLVSRANGVLQ